MRSDLDELVLYFQTVSSSNLSQKIQFMYRVLPVAYGVPCEDAIFCVNNVIRYKISSLVRYIHDVEFNV